MEATEAVMSVVVFLPRSSVPYIPPNQRPPFKIPDIAAIGFHNPLYTYHKIGANALVFLFYVNQ